MSRMPCHSNRDWVPANHTERCRERIEQEFEKEPEGASSIARVRERIKRARHEERASKGQIARSSKELARQALVMVLVLNRKLRGDPLQCLNHNHAQLNRMSVMASPQENKVMTQTWPILTVTGRRRLVAKKAMNGWRPKRNGCEITVVPNEIFALPVTLRADPS